MNYLCYLMELLLTLHIGIHANNISPTHNFLLLNLVNSKQILPEGPKLHAIQY